MSYVETLGGLKNLSPGPDIAFQYQDDGTPWPSVFAAHNGTPEAYRAIGKIRFVDDGDGKGIIEYMYKEGVELEHLVQRFENLESAAAYVAELTDLKNQTQEFKEAAEAASFISQALYEEKGDWKVPSNTPTLTADATVGQTNPEKLQRYTIVEGGNLPFAIKDHAAGSPISKGYLVQHPDGMWFYSPENKELLERFNSTRVQDSGLATGILIPELQYRHVRGEAEMIGDSIWGAPKGAILYEVMAETTVGNRVRIPAYMTVADQPALVRIYKAATYVKNPSLMTQLAEVTIPTGAFNTVPTGFHYLTLPSNVRITAGEYCYVAIWCDTAAKIIFRRWTADVAPGVTPVRHGFLYTSEADQWNVVWSETNVAAGFAQASFDISMINPSEKVAQLAEKVDGDLSGMKTIPSAGNNLYGASLPDYQYIHERGISELDGNGSYGPISVIKGLGLYEPIARPVSFNQVLLKMFMATVGDVTVKVFSAKTVTGTIGAMTELSSVVIPSGLFNSTATGQMTVNLPSYVRADAGSTVFVFAYCATDTKLGIRYYNATFGSGTERHRFYTMASTNANYNDPWAAGATWVASSGAFYAASFVLADSKVSNMSKIPAIETAANDYLVNGLKKSASGELRSTYIPGIQYQHVRGEAEMLGATVFGNTGYFGVGDAIQMSQDVIFNKLEIGLSTKQDAGVVTIRVYKGATLNDAPASMTLLLTQDISSYSFNKSQTDFQVLRFDTPVRAAAGEVIHAYAHSTLDNNVQIRCFIADSGVAPLRSRFKFKTSNNGWDAAWNNSSASLYATPFRLSLVNDLTDKKVQDLTLKVVKNPRLVVPMKIYAVVGVELSLYYDALVFGKDNGLASPEGFSVDITCLKGVCKERYWRLNAISTDVGTHTMVIAVYDSNGVQLITKTISLIIVAATNPAAQKYIVDEGDSTIADTNSRVAMNENFAAMTGGLAPIFLGTAGLNPTKSEAFGGSTFLGHISQTMIITGGNRPNSFWNAAANGGLGGIDIAYYKTTVLGHGGNIDLANIQLGINDTNTVLLSETDLQTIADRSKTLVNAWLAGDSNVKVVVHLPLIDINVMWGGNKMVYRTNMWRLRELLLATYDNNVFNARVFIGQASLCVDRYWGYRITVPTAAARRYPELVITHTDNVHPRAEGYKEMGDAKFAQSLALLQ